MITIECILVMIVHIVRAADSAFTGTFPTASTSDGDKVDQHDDHRGWIANTKAMSIESHALGLSIEASDRECDRPGSRQ